ncbi:MAG: hypothetical protein LBI38_07605 [Oscillospiraceae bacterium]|jgi:hypothetical protein|nr:hypothetical protein [Oscillospiraceae bacterium]
MVLSKNEQIALYVVIVIVILATGVFIFLLPEYKKINVNKSALETKKVELSELEAELNDAAENALNDSILEAYKVGRVTAESFYEEMNEYEADRELRRILNEGVKDPFDSKALELDTNNMKITGLSTEPLSSSLFYPPDVAYPIKDKSKVDTSIYDTGENAEGNVGDIDNIDVLISMMPYMSKEDALEFYEETRKNGLKPLLVQTMWEFLTNYSETVAVQTITFEINLTKPEVEAIGMYLLNSDKAAYIKSVKFDVLDMDAETASDGVSVTVSEGEARPPDRKYDPLKKCTVEISFLCVQRMDELDEAKIKQK